MTSISHETITGGHLASRKTREKIMSNFYWPGIDGDVTRYCRSCDVCQKMVSKVTTLKVPLHSVPVVDVLFKRVCPYCAMGTGFTDVHQSGKINQSINQTPKRFERISDVDCSRHNYWRSSRN